MFLDLFSMFLVLSINCQGISAISRVSVCLYLFSTQFRFVKCPRTFGEYCSTYLALLVANPMCQLVFVGKKVLLFTDKYNFASIVSSFDMITLLIVYISRYSLLKCFRGRAH